MSERQQRSEATHPPRRGVQETYNKRSWGIRSMDIDMSVHHATLKPRKLLRNDGTISTQIVESVRRPTRASEKDNASFNGGTRLLTLRSFLSANAIRSTDSMDGIDWCSSNNSRPCALRNVTVPILITAMGGHYFIRDNEIHYEAAASADKDFIVRRSDPWHPPLYGLRDDSRPVFEQREQLLRLRAEVDQRTFPH